MGDRLKPVWSRTRSVPLVREKGLMRSEGLDAALIGSLGLSLPFANFALFQWRGFGVDLSHLLGALLLIATAAGSLRRRTRPSLPLLFCSLAFLAVPLLPFALHRQPGFSVPQFWKTYSHLAFLIGVFLAIDSSRLSPEHFWRILSLLVLEAVLLSLYGLWQSIAFSRGWPTGIGFLNRFGAHELRGRSGQGWRATAVFEEPKWLAIYLLPALCYAYGLAVRALREGRDRLRNFWIVAMFLLIAGIVATGSLGEIPVMAILTTAALAHLALLLPSRAERIGALAGLAILLLVFALSVIVSRSATFELFRTRVWTELKTRNAADAQLAPSWAYRENFRYAVRVFEDSPWFGIGVGQFAPVGRVRGGDLGISPELTKDGPWIGLGGLLAEFGLLGLAALGLLLLSILRRATRAAASANAFRAMTPLLVAAVFLKEASAGFYVHFWTWFPLGIAALSARLASREVLTTAGGREELRTRPS